MLITLFILLYVVPACCVVYFAIKQTKKLGVLSLEDLGYYALGALMPILNCGVVFIRIQELASNWDDIILWRAKK